MRVVSLAAVGLIAARTRRPAAPVLAGPSATGPAGRRHWWGVGALTAVAAFVYTAFALTQHWTLHTSSFDSVIFDQEVQGFARWGAPIVPVKGVHAGFGPHFNVLGDHFTPIFAVLAPFYHLWPSVSLLLVAQALLFAVSAVPVWLFTRRALGARVAYLVTGAYLLAWGLQSALQYDVHEVMFAVPLVAWAIERVQARHPWQATALATLTLFVKEDYGLFLAAFGLYLAITGWRRLGAGVFVLGLVGFGVTTQVVVPALAGGHAFYYFGETELGHGLGSIAGFMLRHPLRTLHIALTPAGKWHTLLWTFLPWGLLSLLSPLVVLTVPLLGVRLLGTNPHWWGVHHQYSATLMPIVTLAAVDGLRRVLPRLRPAWAGRVATGWAVALLAVAVALTAYFPLHRVLSPAQWGLDRWQRDAYAAVRVVPDGVTIEADSRLGPHLADRTTVWLLDKQPRWAPWVLVLTTRREWPFDTAAQARERVRLLRASGYRTVYDHAGWLLLHRP